MLSRTSIHYPLKKTKISPSYLRQMFHSDFIHLSTFSFLHSFNSSLLDGGHFVRNMTKKTGINIYLPLSAKLLVGHLQTFFFSQYWIYQATYLILLVWLFYSYSQLRVWDVEAFSSLHLVNMDEQPPQAKHYSRSPWPRSLNKTNKPSISDVLEPSHISLQKPITKISGILQVSC